MRIFVRMLLLLALSQLAACSDNLAAPAKGETVAGFSLPDLQGRSVDYPGDFKQRVVLLSFWADWCPLCKKEMRDFEQLYRKYHQRGLSVIAVNVKQDRDTARAFVKDLELSYQLPLDADGELAKDFAIHSLPAALIIDRQGRLHTRILGAVDVESIEQIITSLL